MALPTYNLKCPTANAPALHCPQVGAGRLLSSSSCVGSPGLWALWRQCPSLGSQRSSMGKVKAMGPKKEAGKGGEGERRELKLEAADLMELEFGRLLGEPRQATLAKVIGRKVNPEISYIEIEKKPIKKIQRSSASGLSETDFSRLLNQEGRPGPRPPNAVQLAARTSAVEQTGDLPDLVRPPLRPGVPLPQESRRASSVKSGNGGSTPQGKKAVPLVTFGPGGFAAQSNKQKVEGDDYMGLVRKPTIGSDDSYTPSWPSTEVIPPMLIGKAKRPVELDDDALLRRPTPGDESRADASSSVVDRDARFRKSGDARELSLSGKPSLGRPIRGGAAAKAPQLDLPSPDMSEERFAKLLELAGSSESDGGQEGPSDTTTTTTTAAPRAATVDTSSNRKPAPRLGSKPMPATKLPPRPIENEEKSAPEDVLANSSSEQVTKPSFSSPIVDLEMAMLENEAAELTVIRPGQAKPISPTRPAPAIAEKPVLRPSRSPSPSKEPPSPSTEVGLPQEPAAAMTSPSDEKRIKRPAPALQKPALRPPATPSPAASLNNDPENMSAERAESALGASVPSTVPEVTSSLTVPSPPSATMDNDEEERTFLGVEQGMELEENVANSIEMVEGEDAQSALKRPILRLAKKVSPVAPARPPKRFVPAIPGPLKAELVASAGDETVESDRLAGWSEEVKAAVRRSEAALQRDEQTLPSETEFDRRLQQQKPDLASSLLKRPVPPPSPSQPLPDPIEVTMQQLSATRPAVPSPKPEGAPASDTTAKQLQEAAAAQFDRRIPSKEEEDQDWARAEALQDSKTVEEVVFTGANAGGMLLNFGSLVGFLPAWELSGRRRPPSFTTWLQENGYTAKQSTSSSASKASVPSTMNETGTVSPNLEGTQEATDDAEYKRLLQQYREARASLLSGLIGETARVVVVGLERERRQLRLSEKVAEGEGQELAQKKDQLMASLKVGDVVTCTVKKVTNFGAFVELQGVPALIHISELSWNRITDPTTVVSVGQEVETKVCRLDRYLQRINLSLKQMQPDPLRETLESLVSGDLIENLSDMRSRKDDETAEIPELDGVIKRLEAYKGIDSVRKGRRIQGTALAPTFQVYLSGPLDNGFKLLARSGNQVQEVVVQTALDRDTMKDAIRDCTFSDD